MATLPLVTPYYVGSHKVQFLALCFFLIYVNGLCKVSEYVDLVLFTNDTTYLFLIKTQIVF